MNQMLFSQASAASFMAAKRSVENAKPVSVMADAEITTTPTSFFTNTSLFFTENIRTHAHIEAFGFDDDFVDDEGFDDEDDEFWDDELPEEEFDESEFDFEDDDFDEGDDWEDDEDFYDDEDDFEEFDEEGEDEE